jgi:hypothetical protein
LSIVAQRDLPQRIALLNGHLGSRILLFDGLSGRAWNAQNRAWPYPRRSGHTRVSCHQFLPTRTGAQMLPRNLPERIARFHGNSSRSLCQIHINLNYWCLRNHRCDNRWCNRYNYHRLRDYRNRRSRRNNSLSRRNFRPRKRITNFSTARHLEFWCHDRSVLSTLDRQNGMCQHRLRNVHRELRRLLPLRALPVPRDNAAPLRPTIPSGGKLLRNPFLARALRPEPEQLPSSALLLPRGRPHPEFLFSANLRWYKRGEIFSWLILCGPSLAAPLQQHRLARAKSPARTNSARTPVRPNTMHFAVKGPIGLGACFP